MVKRGNEVVDITPRPQRRQRPEVDPNVVFTVKKISYGEDIVEPVKPVIEIPEYKESEIEESKSNDENSSTEVDSQIPEYEASGEDEQPEDEISDDLGGTPQVPSVEDEISTSEEEIKTESEEASDQIEQSIQEEIPYVAPVVEEAKIEEIPAVESKIEELPKQERQTKKSEKSKKDTRKSQSTKSSEPVVEKPKAVSRKVSAEEFVEQMR
jgi:hypothetical protein